MKRKVWTTWGIPAVAIFLFIAVAGWLALRHHQQALNSATSSSANSPVDPGAKLHGRPAPNFTLVDQFGKKVSLQQFKGKIVVLAFVDSECTTICPLTTQSMMDALQQLGPAAAKDVQLLGINANPTAIKVADVRNYSVDHAMMHSWHFLTGSLSQLKTVWKHYFIYTGIVKGQIDHTPALYIIDQKGHEQILYLTPNQYGAVSAQANVLAHDIAHFLPTSVPTHIANVTYQQPGYGLKSVITLPRETASGIKGTVTLQPSKPQLLAFFASWVSNIKQNLTELNTYASAPNHPNVVAIDVGSTEPSMSSMQPYLKQLGSLAYPVALDKSGNLADVYNVQDLMWLTLTDGKGHIIWSHDGWLPIQTLNKDIANALKKHAVSNS